MIKAVAPGLVYKSDVGAVKLDLAPQIVGQEAKLMIDRLQKIGFQASGFIVQPKPVELLKDVSVRLTSISEKDIDEMLLSLKAFPIFQGYRGGPVYDISPLKQLIGKVGAMGEDIHEIAELDLNPVIIRPQGLDIVDARVRISKAKPSS